MLNCILPFQPSANPKMFFYKPPCSAKESALEWDLAATELEIDCPFPLVPEMEWEEPPPDVLLFATTSPPRDVANALEVPFLPPARELALDAPVPLVTD